jgi:hypothetical protein
MMKKLLGLLNGQFYITKNQMDQDELNPNIEIYLQWLEVEDAKTSLIECSIASWGFFFFKHS